MLSICPSGFVAMEDLCELAERSWNLGARPSWLSGRSFPLPIGGIRSQRQQAVRMLAEALGPRLADGALRAAGMDQHDGSVVWIPAATWRLIKNPEWCGTTNLMSALEGQFIRVVGGDGIPRECVALLTMSDAYSFMNRPDPGQPLGVEPVDLTPVTMRPPQAPEPSPAAPEKAKRNPGGRQPRHDWDGFWIEVVLYAAKNDLAAEDRPDLQRHMETWSTETWTDPPDAETIRKKIRALFARVTPPN